MHTWTFSGGIVRDEDGAVAMIMPRDRAPTERGVWEREGGKESTNAQALHDKILSHLRPRSSRRYSCITIKPC